MADLFTKLMTKFIQKKYLIEKKDDKFIAKPFTLILNTDVANSNFHKEVGFKKECVVLWLQYHNT